VPSFFILRAFFGRGFQKSSCMSIRQPEVALLNRLVFENLRQRPVRTCLSVLAIGVEVTMILTLVGISYAAMSMVENVRNAMCLRLFVLSS